MIDAYPIFLTSWIAAGDTAPAHATVDSTLAKFRIPSTSCLTTCALTGVAARQPATTSTASAEVRCMPHLLFTRNSLARTSSGFQPVQLTTPRPRNRDVGGGALPA